jgi:hypothetical protein
VNQAGIIPNIPPPFIRPNQAYMTRDNDFLVTDEISCGYIHDGPQLIVKTIFNGK